MKNKIKNIYFLGLLSIVITCFLPIVVNADVTYSATFASGYEYGDVSECTTKTGIAYFKRIVDVSGVKVCLWTVENPETRLFSCADSSMERFTLPKVSGSDGKTYYGYGCRKAKDDSQINYIEVSLYVGEGQGFGTTGLDTCEILEGDAGTWNRNNSCYLDAKKAGTVKVKVTNNTTKVSKYYIVTITNADSSSADLDDDYFYGDVDQCNIKGMGGKITLGNYTFCASKAAGYDYEYNTISCKNSDYETFKLTFTSNGALYKGYGCRKIKNENNRDYEQKTLYVGEGVQVASQYNNTCTIISGSGGSFDDFNRCYLHGNSVGSVKVKAVNEDSGEHLYYEYKITNKPVTNGGNGSSGGNTGENKDDKSAINYANLCSNYDDGIGKAVRFLGYIVFLLKIIVPLIIIILGIVDLVKAVVSGDDKGIGKATSSLIKRFVAGAVAVLAPSFIIAVMNILITDDLEKTTRFEACTKCILDATKYCPLD